MKVVLGKFGVIIPTIVLFIIFLSQTSVDAQNCRFDMHMGEKFDKCASVCQGRKYKCVADDTCLCQECPNSGDNNFVNTFDDAVCEISQECTRKCMEANSEPDHGGYIGKGKRCHFQDDYYGSQSSTCVCACL